MFLKDWSCAPWTAVGNILAGMFIGVPFAQVNIICWLQYIWRLNQHSTLLALLVGALQAEVVDQWEMWERQVSKYIDTGTLVQKYQNILTLYKK